MQISQQDTAIMLSQDFQLFTEFMRTLCARAKLFAHMQSLKKTMDEPSGRVWSVCHVALKSPESWALRLQSVEPDMPELLEETHSISEIKTLENLSLSAPLPMTNAWKQRLACVNNDDLDSEQWRYVADELFNQLWITGEQLSKQPCYHGYTLDHIEVLEQHVAVFFFVNGSDCMLTRFELHEIAFNRANLQSIPAVMPHWSVWTDPTFTDLDFLEH